MKKDIKIIAVKVPKPLYSLFLKSRLRKTSASDAEAVRTAIKQAIKVDEKPAPSVA